MMKTYGDELRAILIDAIKKVASGQMSIEAGEAVCALAQQANNSVIADARMIASVPPMLPSENS